MGENVSLKGRAARAYLFVNNQLNNYEAILSKPAERQTENWIIKDITAEEIQASRKRAAQDRKESPQVLKEQQEELDMALKDYVKTRQKQVDALSELSKD